MISPALAMISGAPPAPGRRTVGLCQSPMNDVLRLPYRSTWAAPKNPTSTFPPCSTYPKRACMPITDSAPETRTKSAMPSAIASGWAPQMPDS